MGETTRKTYTKGELFGYLVGMFGQNLIYQVIAAGLVSYYLGSVLYIPAAAVSVIIFVARIWDAINDPMMGTIVDRTHTKWGKCRPYLIIFPAIIGAMTILCFVNGRYTDAEGFSKVLIVAWATLSYIVWGMLFTVCDIPLWGITSLMTEDENDRSKILGLARIAAGVGGIGTVITFVPDMFEGLFENKYNAMIGIDGYTAEMALNDTKRAAWIFTVVIITIFATICFEIAGIVTRERVPGDAKDKRGIKDNFKIMWNCLPFRQILISGVLRSPLQLLLLLAMPLAKYYYLDNDTENISKGDDSLILLKVGLIAVAVFVAQFVAMAITPSLVRKYENKKIYNFYTVVGAVPYVLIFVAYLLSKGNLLPMGWVIVTVICIALASASMGGINVMQSIMIADCVDYEEYHKGYRPDGVFFSGQSFLTKLSGGIAALIQGLVYTIVGFSGKNLADINNRLATAGEHFYEMDGGKYAAAMFFLISIPVAVGLLLSAVPMKKYTMSDAEHKEMLDELVARRNGEGVSETEEFTDDATAEAVKALEENMDALVEEINKINAETPSDSEETPEETTETEE